MRLFDHDYYKTFLEDGMDESEFKKRLIVALEAEQRIDPEHFQAICDGEDAEFVRMVKEEYLSALSVKGKDSTITDEESVRERNIDDSVSEISVEVASPEEEIDTDELSEEIDTSIEDEIQKDLEKQEKAMEKQAKAKKSREQQERYRLEAQAREQQYRDWQAGLPKDISFSEADRGNPYVAPSPDVASSYVAYSYTPYSYDREPSPADSYPYTYPSPPTPDEVYKKRRNEEYDLHKQERKEQIRDDINDIQHRYYEKQKAYESYESVNQNGHFPFGEQKESYPSGLNHIPYNVYATPYLSYENNIYDLHVSITTGYNEPKVEYWKPRYEHYEPRESYYESHKTAHYESYRRTPQDSLQNSLPRNVPYNVFRSPYMSVSYTQNAPVYKPHIYDSTNYTSPNYSSSKYSAPKYGEPKNSVLNYSASNYRSYVYKTALLTAHTYDHLTYKTPVSSASASKTASYNSKIYHAPQTLNSSQILYSPQKLHSPQTYHSPTYAAPSHNQHVYNVLAHNPYIYKALNHSAPSYIPHAYNYSVYKHPKNLSYQFAPQTASQNQPAPSRIRQARVSPTITSGSNASQNSTPPPSSRPTPGSSPFSSPSSNFGSGSRSGSGSNVSSNAASNSGFRGGSSSGSNNGSGGSGSKSTPGSTSQGIPRTNTSRSQQVLARKASRLNARYHSLYSSNSGMKQKMAAFMHVTGYTRLSNRARMEFTRYMRSSMSSGDETGDAVRIWHQYGDKVRFAGATGSLITTHLFSAGEKSAIYETAFNKKLKADLKNVKVAYKGQGTGFTLRDKLVNAEHTLKCINGRIAILEKLDGGTNKYANQITALKQKRVKQENLISNLKSGFKKTQTIQDGYWKNRSIMTSTLKKGKKNLSALENQLGLGGAPTNKIKKEIKILLKKKKLGLLSAAEASRLDNLQLGLAIRKHRMSRNDRINSRKNLLAYAYYAFRGNSSFEDQTGLHGAVKLADFSHNYYVKKTVKSFYKATKMALKATKRVGTVVGKYVAKKAIQTPVGACIDGSIILMKAKANLLINTSKRFAKRQIMTAVNTKVGIGLKMYYLNAKSKLTSSMRFIKRWTDRGAKVLKWVQAPFKYVLKAFQFVKNLLYKLIAIAAGVFLFILLMAIIVDLFGASISIIFAPNVNEDGLVDLTEYVEHLEEVQEDYVADIEDIIDSDYTRIYRNYSYADNTKEILCMMAVRMDQNLGTVYHKSNEMDDCNDQFRGQCRGHRDDLDYIELLYDLSHVAYIKESEPYYCETLDCETRMVTIPVDEEMGRGPTTKMEAYCPGDHVDVTITTQVLRFDEIFTVDTVDATGDITAKKGQKLGDFTITAYCACKKCCGENAQGITATGVKPKENHTIAVDPSVIPLGTVVIINGQAYVAEDTGGAIKGNRIDIYFESHDDALTWGKQTLPVYLGTDIGVKDNDTTGESAWDGWTQENREWAKNLYDTDWSDIYVGYKTLNLDYSGLGIEIEEEEFAAIKEILDSKIGCPYVWGAAGPDSFDCSGLVMYVYETAGLYDWGGARPTTKTLYQECVPIPKAEAKQGDLVLWDVPGNIHHVGIYCGNGIVCHAPQEGDHVRYAKLWGSYGIYRLPEQ